MSDGLVKILKSFNNLPDDQMNKLVSISKTKSIAKGDHFIQEGEVPNKFAFVLGGLFRYFYTNNKGNELTKGFFPEGSVISSYSAMIQNRGSYFTIEALEDSEVSVIQ